MVQKQLTLTGPTWQLPKPETSKEIIYYTIWNNEEITRHEVAAMTGLTLNNVCGRVFELLDEGVITAYKAEGERRERLVIRQWRKQNIWQAWACLHS